MEPVYLKYALFGEQPTVTATLQTFAENYNRVKSGLNAVWAHIQDEESKVESKVADIQGQLVKANEALRAAAGLGAHFFRKDPSQAPLASENKLMRCNCGQDAVIEQEDQSVRCNHCQNFIQPQLFAQLRQQRLQFAGKRFHSQPNMNTD
jgi:hypothetical protein